MSHPGSWLTLLAGPQLRLEADDNDGQRDERVQDARRAPHGGTRGRTGAYGPGRGSYLDINLNINLLYWIL